MANPAVLEQILAKLVAVNLALAATGADIATDIEAIQTLIGTGTAASISADQVVIKAVVDLL